jgi:hypothetical protein
MNPELLYALDLGFGMGVYALVHLLGVWGILRLIGQAGDVGKVAIMSGLGGKAMFQRKLGDVVLELGFFPGGYLQKRVAMAHAELGHGADTVDAQAGLADAPSEEWGGEPLPAYNVTPAQLDAPTGAYAEAAAEVPNYRIPSLWTVLSASWNVVLVFVLLVIAARGSDVGEAIGQFIGLAGRSIGQLFWLGDSVEWEQDFRAVVLGYRMVAWGMAWMILLTLVAVIPDLAVGLLKAESGLRKGLDILRLLLAPFLFIRIAMLSAMLADNFWGCFVLYMLGGFSVQFISYWLVLGVGNMLAGEKGQAA